MPWVKVFALEDVTIRVVSKQGLNIQKEDRIVISWRRPDGTIELLYETAALDLITVSGQMHLVFQYNSRLIKSLDLFTTICQRIVDYCILQALIPHPMEELV